MVRVASGCLGHFILGHFILMIHTAPARKYRPTRFSELVAQQHGAAGLAGAVAQGRVAHGYLLTGPRGVGKTSAARILAMALNCERRGGGGATEVLMVSPAEPAIPAGGSGLVR